AALHEAMITEQGAGEIANAHQRDGPLTVDSQGTPNGADQLRGGIANARLSQVAKIGEVLSHLSVGDAERVAEHAARHPRGAIPQQALKPPQVQAQTTDAGTRRARVAAVRRPG